MDPSEIMRVFDVPPWVAGPYRKPRCARVRWALRRWRKIKAVPEPTLYTEVIHEDALYVEDDFGLRRIS